MPLPWNCMSPNIHPIYTMSNNPLTHGGRGALLWRDHVVVLCLCSHLWLGTKGQYDGCSSTMHNTNACGIKYCLKGHSDALEVCLPSIRMLRLSSSGPFFHQLPTRLCETFNHNILMHAFYNNADKLHIKQFFSLYGESSANLITFTSI